VSEAPEQLFRDAALKQLNSPDDLDRMITITRPVGWLAGLVLGLIIVGAVVWSVVGRLPSRVLGTGILLPAGGQEMEVQAHGSGVLTQLLVNVGDEVTQGQILARLGDTDGERQLAALRANLADRSNELATAQSDAASEQSTRAEALRRQRAALDLRVQNDRNQLQVLNERLATTKSLYAQQLTTRLQVIQTQNELAAATQDLSNAASDAARLGAENDNQERAAAQRLQDRRRAVSDVQQRIDALTAQLADTLNVRSGVAGRVIEIRAQQGSLVRQGQAVAAIEQAGAGLQIVSFIGAQQGKEVLPGMEVRAALGSVRREEYGMLLGHIASISALPVSLDAIRTVIQNEDLARTFEASGPPFMARVTLEPDKNSISGYGWTSQRGDTVAVSSGMSAAVEIVTEWRRPIAMVIPAFRELLGK
jgi:HlyD family secretion protein